MPGLSVTCAIAGWCVAVVVPAGDLQQQGAAGTQADRPPHQARAVRLFGADLLAQGGQTVGDVTDGGVGAVHRLIPGLVPSSLYVSAPFGSAPVVPSRVLV